jgi:serine protease Do
VTRRRAFARVELFLPALLLALAGLLAPAATADEGRPAGTAELSAVLSKEAPENVADLRAMQKQVRAVLDKVIPCTVNIRAGGGQGSGVIVSEDGLILTAGHVAGKPDKDVTVVLPDGRKLKAKTLGVNHNIDSGMVKISDSGKWPFAAMGHSTDLEKGQWVITVGHPGGFQPGRTPVVRLGRVLDVNDRIVRTDCTLVGGDSGGPLFDLSGKVVGIHSRIGGPLTANIHVPVDTYRETWDRLTANPPEEWGSFFGMVNPDGAYMGFKADPESKDCKVTEVMPRSPAAKAGLKVDDVITKFDGHKVGSFDDLREHLDKKKPAQEVAVEVHRDGEVVTLKVVRGNGVHRYRRPLSPEDGARGESVSGRVIPRS